VGLGVLFSGNAGLLFLNPFLYQFPHDSRHGPALLRTLRFELT
jgi:hypothetical protein